MLPANQSSRSFCLDNSHVLFDDQVRTDQLKNFAKYMKQTESEHTRFYSIFCKFIEMTIKIIFNFSTINKFKRELDEIRLLKEKVLAAKKRRAQKEEQLAQMQ